MTTLVTQRYSYDCTVCCLAMLTGLPYEAVLEGLPDYVKRHTPADAPPCAPQTGMSDHDVRGFFDWLGWPRERILLLGDHNQTFEAMQRPLWGRRALVSVRSLNREGGWHSIYYDGARVWDPSPKQRYLFRSAVVPNELWLFADQPEYLTLPPAIVERFFVAPGATAPVGDGVVGG